MEKGFVQQLRNYFHKTAFILVKQIEKFIPLAEMQT